MVPKVSALDSKSLELVLDLEFLELVPDSLAPDSMEIASEERAPNYATEGITPTLQHNPLHGVNDNAKCPIWSAFFLSTKQCKHP